MGIRIALLRNCEGEGWREWEDAAEGGGREGREWYSGIGGEAVSVFNFV